MTIGLQALLRVARDPDDGWVADPTEILTFARLALAANEAMPGIARSSRFVDQDAVGLVDQHEMRRPLHRLFAAGSPSCPSMPPRKSVCPSAIRRSSSRSRRKSKPNSLAVP